jgi:hypothetical protein
VVPSCALANQCCRVECDRLPLAVSLYECIREAQPRATTLISDHARGPRPIANNHLISEQGHSTSSTTMLSTDTVRTTKPRGRQRATALCRRPESRSIRTRQTGLLEAEPAHGQVLLGSVSPRPLLRPRLQEQASANGAMGADQHLMRPVPLAPNGVAPVSAGAGTLASRARKSSAARPHEGIRRAWCYGG